MSRFNSSQRSAFGVVHWLYGDLATWQPAAGGEIQTGKVLFSDPTELMGFNRKGTHVPGMAEFDISACMIEYFVGTFPGLRESVASKNSEYITIEGKRYKVKVITAKYDGKSLYATLTPIS